MQSNARTVVCEIIITVLWLWSECNQRRVLCMHAYTYESGQQDSMRPSRTSSKYTVHSGRR